MPLPKLNTVKDKLDWCYANLAAYEVALEQNPPTYTRAAWAVRARLFKGLQNGTSSISSIYKNERAKLNNAHRCAYCGKETDKLTLDHLYPKKHGGKDDGSNLVYTCQNCNSSKGASDYFDWCDINKMRVNPDVASRYIKNAYALCEQLELLDAPLDDERLLNMPFRIGSLPDHFYLVPGSDM